MRLSPRELFRSLCLAGVMIVAGVSGLRAQSRVEQHPAVLTCVESLPDEVGPAAGNCGNRCDCCNADSWLPSLADDGILFDIDAVQFYQGVASGGLERLFRYGGHNDYVANLDLGKMGLREGLSLKLRGEHRYGETVNDATGAIFNVALLPDLPAEDDTNLVLTNVLFTQAISDSFTIFAGKQDTLDGDENAFAHGRGQDQFFNVAFVSTPITFRGVPYSTLGAGFAVLRDDETIFSFAVLNPTDTSTTSGFSELFRDGVTLTPELRLPTRWFGRPGHQLVGAVWSSAEFNTLDGDPRLSIGPPIAIEPQRGTWSAYWNFDHYLVSDPEDPEHGWGLFGRAGIADKLSNPIHWFLSFGLGGNSPLDGRERDTFGAGWYFVGASNAITPLAEYNNGQGIELFYNAAVGRRLYVTPDFQVIMPSRPGVDTALVPGVRAKIDF